MYISVWCKKNKTHRGQAVIEKNNPLYSRSLNPTSSRDHVVDYFPVAACLTPSIFLSLFSHGFRRRAPPWYLPKSDFF